MELFIVERRVAIVGRGDVGGGEVARLVLVVGSGRILTDALPLAFVDFGDDGIADRATTVRFFHRILNRTQRVGEKRYVLGEKLRRVGGAVALLYRGSRERWCYIFCVVDVLKFSHVQVKSSFRDFATVLPRSHGRTSNTSSPLA